MSRVRTIAAACTALALFAAPAHASDVARVKLGSTIEHLITGTDGGAWVEIDRPTGDAIGRALPGGGFRTAGLEDGPIASALGPDGQAWFRTDEREYVRSDGAGNLTTVGPLPDGPRLGRPIATGPDGTLWNLTPTGDRFAHVTPLGTVSYNASRVPACAPPDEPILIRMERAADGAMWIIDWGCERLLRVTATEAQVIEGFDEDPDAIAADATGGMWFSTDSPSAGVGHVDAAGTVTRFKLDDYAASDVAVAPDGSAWFALEACRLARVTMAGDVTMAPAPIPARELGFDPAGGLWLASNARLVHVAPGESFGPCDNRAATVRVSPSRAVSVKALRRGLRIVVREPAALEVSGFPVDDAGGDPWAAAPFVSRVMPRAGALRYRVPAAHLRRFARRLAEGKRPEFGLLIAVTDAEGNRNVVQRRVRVTR